MFADKGIPYAAGWCVILGELLGGVSLVSGILAHFATPLLLPIMAGAIYTSVLPELRKKWEAGASLSQKVSNFLCTPETQLTIILVTLTLAFWT